MPYISTKVSKLGSSIACVNLPAGVTCRKDAPCQKLCYAKRGNFVYKNVQKNLQNNLDEYLHFPDTYFSLIDHQLTLVPYKYFRWHSSGDIVDENYFARMCRLARKHKKTNFLCFTKKYEIVNNYIESGKYIPKNLTVVFSAWGDFLPDNPYNLPTSYVNLKKESDNCVIPSNTKKCPGYCGDCVLTKDSCWNLSKGESVTFNQH